MERYLNYIMFELIKNSLRAVTERYSKEEVAKHPVKVVVCGDDSTVVIRVSDSGGGIPLGEMQKARARTAIRQWIYTPISVYLYSQVKCIDFLFLEA